jgi:AAA domain
VTITTVVVPAPQLLPILGVEIFLRTCVSNVHILKYIKMDKQNRQFLLAEDLVKLEQVIAQIGNVGLICIDPITAYMGGKMDSHKATEVRSQLGPLKDFAERSGVHRPLRRGRASNSNHSSSTWCRKIGGVGYHASCKGGGRKKPSITLSALRRSLQPLASDTSARRSLMSTVARKEGFGDDGAWVWGWEEKPPVRF